LWLADYRLACQ
jgi:hypothetical protein